MLAERLTAQLLTGKQATDPVSVAERLLAVQAQDLRGARLAIRARSSGLTAAAVDRALSEERSLVITWLNRFTLHLVRSEDYPWLHALTTPRLFNANARRLSDEGVTPVQAERGLATIERSLAREGPLTREQLGERIRADGVRTEGQALVHLLGLASLHGLTVRGPMVGTRHAYVLVRDWLGESATVDRERALGELTRRYLVGHGPADDRDLAKWAGLPLGEVRRGLRAIADELHEREDGLLDLAKRDRAGPMPPPRLLGPFDPLLHGWRSREGVLGPHKSIVTVNGIFRAFALVEGRAVGTWSMPRGEVVLKPFGRLSHGHRVALERDALDVVRYLGGSERASRGSSASVGTS